MNETQQQILKVQTFYKGIRDTAHKTYKAVIVSPFSQSMEPVSSFLKIGEKTQDGICQALVNAWIAAHANEGSIWNEIYTNVHGIPSIQLSKMSQLLLDFTASINDTSISMGPYQKLNSEIYLMKHGVIPRMDMGSGHRLYGEGYKVNTGTGKIDADPGLSHKIISGLKMCKSYGRGVGSYAMVSFKSAKGGHVVALYLGGTGGAKGQLPFSDVAFFDPNFGEFWFDNAANFANFFVFLLGRFYSSYGGWQIRNFGVKVN
jgi:hypothetical protein